MKKLLLLMLATAATITSAKNVEFASMHHNQASPELVALADEVVQEIGYQGNYELVEPNKIGLQTNPWLGMIVSYLNPQTQNNLIVVNPVWFNGLSKDAQKFLIARYFMKLEHTGGLLTVIKIVPYIFIFLSFLLIWLMFLLVNQTALKVKPRWLKILIAYLCGVTINVTVMPKIQQALTLSLDYQYEVDIDQKTLAKLPNKPAAIEALTALDVAIKAGVEEGHNVFKPFEHTFANLAKELQK